MRQISRAAVLWQLIAFIAVVLPHFGWLPWWLIGLCVGAPALRLMIHAGRWPFPHWSIKLALVVAVSGGLLLTFNRDTGMSATVALLVAGLALKMIEIYHRRDALVLLYVALFVAATTFLFYQSIGVALYVMLALGVVITALNSIFQNPMQNDMMRPLRRSGRLLLFSLPMMLVLFLLFPRIGPLWSIPLDRQAARSGLSDTMSPGEISQLTRSDELAFRAAFSDAPPLPSQRYWRSLVYSHFDGRRWTREPWEQRARLEDERLIDESSPVTYEVIYEPSRRRWLVALDQPAVAPRDYRLGYARTLVSDRPVDRRINYEVTSYLQYKLSPELLSERKRALFLQLPEAGNERARALADQWWRAAQQRPEPFVQQVLNYFRGDFSYTLTPPALQGDTIDQFLFETRQGFCGHYAGALAFLLRSVGVPARVVGGYQGGEWNPYEGYLTVRQYDAHAWVEYWQPAGGWVRVDPTAAISPDRVEGSADQVFAQDPAFLSETPLARLRLGQDGWLAELRRRAEAINFNWPRWVLNYQGQQIELLKGLLGQLSMVKMVLAMMGPVALILAAVAWFQLRDRRRRSSDPISRGLTKILKRLERQGFQRHPSEPLHRFLRRVAEAAPEVADPLLRLAQADEAVRYAEEAGQRDTLLSAVKACQNALARNTSVIHKRIEDEKAGR